MDLLTQQVLPSIKKSYKIYKGNHSPQQPSFKKELAMAKERKPIQRER